MKHEDFNQLKNFSALEFEETGGDIERMDIRVFKRLQILRTRLGCRIDLLSTTGGKHEAGSFHYKGEAVDIYLHKDFKPDFLLQEILRAGFRGVGFYKNAGGVKSYHLDIRNKYTFWRGYKKPGQKRWTYGDLVIL